MWLVCSRRMRTSLDFLPRPAREFPSSATLSSWSKGGGELLASQETNGSASRLIGGLAMPQSEGGRRRGRARKMTHDPMHPAPEPDRLRQATRCGARTRSGRPCQSPAVTGRRRCRMHGGARLRWTEGIAQWQLQAWPVQRRRGRLPKLVEAADTRSEGVDQDTAYPERSVTSTISPTLGHDACTPVPPLVG
jgi:hypothetical protein